MRLPLPVAPLFLVSVLILHSTPAMSAVPANSERQPIASPSASAAAPDLPAAPVVRASAPALRSAPGTNVARTLGNRPAGVMRERTAAPSAQPIPRDTGPFVKSMPANSSGVPVVPWRLLYAPAADDDPAYRNAIGAVTGGAVDYLDARVATPTAIELSAYDCVYTWPNNGYLDATLMGDRLADFVDAGGKVILGVFCTYTAGAELSGRIMTPAYSPVTSPLGSNHFSNSAYIGDGTTSLHAGVLAYAANFRDVLVVQGGGIVDGHYADGEIAAAYRPDGRVIYLNGMGSPLSGTGDWPLLVANAWMGIPTAPGVLYAPAWNDNASYRAQIATATGGPVHYFDGLAGTPAGALLGTYDGVLTWANNPYFDRVGMGDALADFVDTGGRVVLGAFTTFDNGGLPVLGGRIMTPLYSPVVSPTGTNHADPFPYLGDGVSCAHEGVVAYEHTFRDRLVVQGAGIADGHFSDGEIALAYRPDGRVVFANGTAGGIGSIGDGVQVIANAMSCTLATGPAMLYAPSDDDDPALRALLSTYTGGPVDYFDPRVATPTVQQLDAYACVFTWANYGYQDPVLMGNRLAEYVDHGGRVILGEYCTYTNGNYLDGAIMGPGYAPVSSPTGSVHGSLGAYAGDGTTRLLHDVTGFDSGVRDVLQLQGAGIVDATYDDGEIAVAYRPDRRVISLNCGVSGGSGDWPAVVGNAAVAPAPYAGIMYGTTTDGALLTFDLVTGAATQVGTLPFPGATELEIDESTGHSFYQLPDGAFAAQQIFFRTGTGMGPPVPNGGSFVGLEYALGRLYGTVMSEPCGAAEMRILNPFTGVSTLVAAAAPGPIPGLAFDKRTSAMYGINALCAGPVHLHRFDLPGEVAPALIGGPIGVQLGSLEFGPDGDLYGGGNNNDGGNLYRINPTTGVARLIGASGFMGVTGLALATPNVADVGPPAGPVRLALAAAPNPARGGDVRIAFTLPRAGAVTVEVFDIAGRSVWRHTRASLPAGAHGVVWNGAGADGRRVAGGVYLARLVTPDGSRTTRIVQLD